MPKSTSEKVSVKKGALTRNPFLNFLRDFRKHVTGKTQMDITRQGGRVWNNMTEAERQPYKNMAKTVPAKRRKRRRKRSVSSSSDSSTLSRRNRKRLKRKLSQKRRPSKKRRKNKEPPKDTSDNEKSEELTQKQNQDAPPPTELVVENSPETENNVDNK